MGKTVIFGGTFNPVHSGHKKMALCIAKRAEVEQILIVPTKLPVHKSVGNVLASSEHRMEMCRLAFSDIPKVQYSDIELQSEEKNYSITTVRRLKENFPEKEFVFLIGGDSLVQFHTWYEYRKLLQEIPLYVFGRGSCPPSDFEAAAQKLRAEGGNITIIEEEIPNISSSEIREKIKNSQSLGELVPAKVESYIYRQGLYLEENGFDS